MKENSTQNNHILFLYNELPLDVNEGIAEDILSHPQVESELLELKSAIGLLNEIPTCRPSKKSFNRIIEYAENAKFKVLEPLS